MTEGNRHKRDQAPIASSFGCRDDEVKTTMHILLYEIHFKKV